jgi:hypothetical protein
MAEYLDVGEMWINTDKITRVKVSGSAKEPILQVYFQGDTAPETLEGHQAQKLPYFLKGHRTGE